MERSEKKMAEGSVHPAEDREGNSMGKNSQESVRPIAGEITVKEVTTIRGEKWHWVRIGR